MSGKVALVTGSGRGIGLAATRRFLAERRAFLLKAIPEAPAATRAAGLAVEKPAAAAN